MDNEDLFYREKELLDQTHALLTSLLLLVKAATIFTSGDADEIAPLVDGDHLLSVFVLNAPRSKLHSKAFVLSYLDSIRRLLEEHGDVARAALAEIDSFQELF